MEHQKKNNVLYNVKKEPGKKRKHSFLLLPFSYFLLRDNKKRVESLISGWQFRLCRTNRAIPSPERQRAAGILF